MGILAVFLPHERILLPGLIWLCICSSAKKYVKKCVFVEGEGQTFCEAGQGPVTFTLLTQCFVAQADR